MIFLTVGTQLPFDRLIKLVDDLVPELDEEVVGQIGFGKYQPKNMHWTSSLTAVEFDKRAAEASVIVSHAGIGSVLTAKRFRKPIVVFPRAATLGEHRNDHQLATASLLFGRPGIYIANNAASLGTALRQAHTLRRPTNEESAERGQLVSFLRETMQPAR
ncbi:glycosyltransferase [Rhodoblastus sp.]|jgi:UDP-N-acetylglucosamine transferase subunit ALG13|uniref:glycosyltransferase n=1 Tax=Rhodoblastus sp. TaxID=1962975 RepID=UPI0025FA35D6|nr:glycosyltransferase [Rhodoblastus sp.]